jgi:hypothetical protein
MLGFLSSVVSHLTTGLPVATDETRDARLALCGQCPHFRHSDKRCSLCGCYTAIKAQWRGEKCPDGRW